MFASPFARLVVTNTGPSEITKSDELLTALPSGFVTIILTFCPFVNPAVPVVKLIVVALEKVTDVASCIAPFALCNSTFGIDA